MFLSSLLLLGTTAAAPAPAALAPGDLFVIKARRVELGDGEVMEHAVILVEDGSIVTMGQDLPIERGIPVIELDDDQVVMPGVVNPYSRIGMSGKGFNDSRPQVMASGELYPTSAYEAFLENGITTVAQYPAGDGIPGQAVALRPTGDAPEEMILEDGVYLKVVMQNSGAKKRNLREGFEKADEYLDEVKKAREEFEEKQKKSKKSKSKKKDDDEKDDDKEEDDKKKDDEPKEFVPPEVDPRVQPFFDLREGDLRALVSVRNAASFVHLVDAIGDEEFEWHLRIPLTRDCNIFHVKEDIGETGCFVLMEPLITLMPGTMRQRNLPAEFDRAGAKLVLLPRRDDVRSLQSLYDDVGVMIAAGLDRKAAVRALTHNPAAFLGLDDRIGMLAEGKRANLVVFSGDPFQPGTEIDAVMVDGEFVSGDIDQ
ncbi:MAG: amidohydrolase family protein [Planctomycetota bacterium]